MLHKPRKKPEVTMKMGLLDRIDSAFADVFIGEMPTIIPEYCVTGVVNFKLKSHLSKVINEITSKRGCKHKNFKFGKSGRPAKRVSYDYRKLSYEHMYLLYESSSKANVEELEKYYVKKYIEDRRCDNIDVNSLGKMKSNSGRYYLYIVI